VITTVFSFSLGPEFYHNLSQVPYGISQYTNSSFYRKDAPSSAKVENVWSYTSTPL